MSPAFIQHSTYCIASDIKAGDICLGMRLGSTQSIEVPHVGTILLVHFTTQLVLTMLRWWIRD